MMGDLTGTTVLHYHILKRVGQGGMGVVYQAEDTRLKRKVAIKFLPTHVAENSAVRQRFTIEAQAAAALNHPNITTIYAIEEFNNELFIVMEYVEGMELGAKIGSHPLELQEGLQIAIQIADGLEAAHEKGIVHRDIKPSNIMLTGKGQVKIMDFGLAKTGEGVRITQTGSTLGTTAYISPEQLKGETVDHRTDIWALGATLYEMFTGRLPFPGEYTQAVHYAIINEEPKPMRDIRADLPEELESPVKYALAKDVNQRYASVKDLRKALQHLQQRLTGASSSLLYSGMPKESSYASETPAKRPPSDSAISSSAERRQMTVMICELSAATGEGELSDPEELYQNLPVYEEILIKVIRRFEGHIEQASRDEFVVFFGYPRAHEDDGIRAVNAGIGILNGIRNLNEQHNREGLAVMDVRISIHTGLVVVEDLGQQMRSVVGEMPRIASRILHHSDLNTLVISFATFELVKDYFDCEPQGSHEIKGLRQPLLLYRVIHERPVRNRLKIAAISNLTPLIGRDTEYGMLIDRWEQAREEMGQVILLSGEAGIGKSRLLTALAEHVVKEQKVWLTEFHCSPYHQNSSLYPVIDYLERMVLEVAKEHSGESKLVKIEGFLAQYGFSLPETVPLFANILSVPLDERYQPLNLSPEKQKQKLLQTMVQLVLKRASRQPLLIIYEDLHWADPSTRELLTRIIEQVPTTSIMMVLTYRPEFTPPWSGGSYITHLTLSRLAKKQIRNLAEKISRDKALPEEVIQEVINKTDGVPLFIEELTKMLLESDILIEEDDRYQIAGRIPAQVIPTTLRDSLTARLDRLSTGKTVAQLGATLGREFSYQFIQTLSPLEESTLKTELTNLVQAELLYQRGVPPDVTYIFKHALIQDAAYQSLLKSTRQEYHHQIARMLEDQFPETVASRPELLAHHFTAANLYQQAVPYWQKAGQLSISHSANAEAIAHLSKGLEVLKKWSESPERMQQELMLQMPLGLANIALKGYSNPEVEQAFARAREICRKLGDPPQLFPVLWGLWAFYITRRDFQQAQELGDQMEEMAEAQEDTDLLLEAHTAQGLNYFYSKGDFVTARAHFEKAVSLYDIEKHRSHLTTYLQDPSVVSLSHLSWILWIMGYLEQAHQMSEASIRAAEAVAHLYSMGFARTWVAVFHQLRGDARSALAAAEAVIELSAEQGFALWLTDGQIIRGWSLVRQDAAEEGLAGLQQGIDTWKAMGARLWQTHQLGLLMEAFLITAQIDPGLSVAREALETVDHTGETYYKPELLRLKGRLLLQQSTSNKPAAESCFLEARDLAREKQAKIWELRAVLDLCRLRHQEEAKKAEAYRMLSEVYEKFSEKLESPDLQEAEALLREFKALKTDLQQPGETH